MKILVIGDGDSLQECKEKFGAGHEYYQTASHLEARRLFKDTPVVFDFLIEEDTSQIHVFVDCPATVFLNCTKSTLAAIVDNHNIPSVFGFNGLPTFVNRPVLEVTPLNTAHRQALENICSQLKTSFEIVDDKPGMVTPRIVCMIINEAYCTMQDGTATAADIDTAMKLGTNYPFGPVEWSKKIGIKNIVDVLDAVYKTTTDERYRICDLLFEEARREG